MPIQSLMIAGLDTKYTPAFIANIFWTKYIAKLASVTLIPYLDNDNLYNIAYITISSWCDSEDAYKTIQCLTNTAQAYLFVNIQTSWLLKINTHNNGDLQVGPYTKVFSTDYYANPEPEPVKSKS